MKTNNIRMEAASALLTLALAAGSASAGTQEGAAGAAAAAFESLGAMGGASISPMSHMDAPPIGEPARHQRNGWSEASRICERMLSGSAHSCQDTVRRARFFTPEAVDVCAAMSYDADKAACLRTIADHSLPSREAWECGRSRLDADKLACLSRLSHLSPGGGGWGQDPWGPGEGYGGMEEAATVCRGLTYDSSKTQCVRIIGSARFFSPEAARVCGGMDYDSTANNCLEAIKDKHISPQAASLCGEMTYDSSKLECLRDSGSAARDPREGPWGPDRGWDSRGMDEAAQACRKLSYDSNRKDCVRLLGTARFFSPEAARVCAGLNYDSSVLSCLGAVKDRDIPPSLARVCGDMNYDSETISCFNGVGGR